MTVTGTEGIYHFNGSKLKQRLIELDVSHIDIPIPKDVLIDLEIGSTHVEDMEHFARTQGELDILFRQFSRSNVGRYAPVDSAPQLEMSLKLFFEEYLGINEFDAIKVVLYAQNRPRFIEVIDRALVKFEKLQEVEAALIDKRIEENNWDVPSERIYNDLYLEVPAPTHALEPFYEYKSASTPERRFVEFLESHEAHIEWWYKNGDKNKEDFAITYIDRNGISRGFYIDFVLKLKNGKIALFDTKTLDSDVEFCNKHNSLVNYIQEQNNKGKQLLGGVIVPKADDVWKYCDNIITSAKDSTGWISFDPGLIN